MQKSFQCLKKGDRTCISNYCPIAILPFFSKVIEKCIEKRLTKYLSKFNILSPNQFGFRAGSSTDYAILSFTGKIKSAIDAGFYAGSVFIDLSKAFDSITHVILISKLQAVGVDGPVPKLIKSYLTDRRQAVSISSSLSNFRIINKGVPQGSILGLLLFLLEIYDLPNCLSQTEAFLYADGTTLLASDRSLTVLTAKLNTDLHNILAWCHLNLLKINPTKTSFMLFHSSRKTPEFLPTVILDSHVISAVDECSFLGVTLDSNLKFMKHIAHLKHKIAPGIRILIKAR